MINEEKKYIAPNAAQVVARGLTGEHPSNPQIRWRMVPRVTTATLRHQWNQRVRRDKHHLAAHAAGVHDGDQNIRVECPRCRPIIPVYPQSLADYGYNRKGL